MPACGERYRYLLKTGSGLTPDSPYTKVLGEEVPNPYNYHEWKEAAELMWSRAWDALQRLGEIETKLGKGWPKWNEVQPTYERTREAFDKLPNVMLVAPITGVPLAIKVAEDFACVLDMADTAIEGYGHKATSGGATKGGGGGSWVDLLLPVALIGGIGYGVYYLEKRQGG